MDATFSGTAPPSPRTTDTFFEPVYSVTPSIMNANQHGIAHSIASRGLLLLVGHFTPMLPLFLYQYLFFVRSFFLLFFLLTGALIAASIALERIVWLSSVLEFADLGKFHDRR